MKSFFCIFMLVFMATISTAQIVADADNHGSNNAAKELGVTSKALPNRGRVQLSLFSSYRVNWDVNGGIETSANAAFVGIAKAKVYENFCPYPAKGEVLEIKIFDSERKTVSHKIYAFSSKQPTFFDLQSGYIFYAILRERKQGDVAER